MRKNVLIAIAAVLIIGGGAGVYLMLSRDNAPAGPSTVVDGLTVTAPDQRCVHDVEDLSNPWITNGRLVAVVGGRVETMTTADATARSMAGEEINGVWLCPPA